VFRSDKDHKIESLPDIDTSANSAVFDRDSDLWFGAGDGLSRVPFSDGQSSYGFNQAAERFTETQGLSGRSVE
jgi:hypothetical protein